VREQVAEEFRRVVVIFPWNVGGGSVRGSVRCCHRSVRCHTGVAIVTVAITKRLPSIHVVYDIPHRNVVGTSTPPPLLGPLPQHDFPYEHVVRPVRFVVAGHSPAYFGGRGHDDG